MKNPCNDNVNNKPQVECILSNNELDSVFCPSVQFNPTWTQFQDGFINEIGKARKDYVLRINSSQELFQK